MTLKKARGRNSSWRNLVLRLRFLARFSRKRLARAPDFASKVLSGRVRFRRLRDFSQLPSDLLHRFPPSSVVQVRLSRRVRASENYVSLGSPSLAVMRAHGVVFEPNQEVLLQRGHPFVQRPTPVNSAPLPTEDLSLGSDIVGASFRRFGWIDVGLSEVQLVDRGILLNGRFANNWYHWMVNILPKAFLLEQSGQVPPEVPLLVPAEIRGTNMFEALQFVKRREREVLFLNSEPHEVGTAYVIEAPTREVSHVKGLRRFTWETLGTFHTELMGAYRESLRVGCGRAIAGHSFPRHERVFLLRAGRTRPFNETEVVAALEPLGFVAIDVEALTFVEQVALFTHVKFVVSTTGAQWTGFFFSEDAVGVILVPDFLGHSSLFAKLGHLGGSTLFEEHIEVNEREWYSYFGTSVPAVVDLSGLVTTVQRLLHGSRRGGVE